MKDKIYCVCDDPYGECIEIMTTDLRIALDKMTMIWNKYLTIYYDNTKRTQPLLYLNPSQFMIEIANLCDQDLTKEARAILTPYIERYLDEEERKMIEAENKKREQELKLLAELKAKYEN